MVRRWILSSAFQKSEHRCLGKLSNLPKVQELANLGFEPTIHKVHKVVEKSAQRA